jgi:hypothetical protein
MKILKADNFFVGAAANARGALKSDQEKEHDGRTTQRL